MRTSFDLGRQLAASGLVVFAVFQVVGCGGSTNSDMTDGQSVLDAKDRTIQQATAFTAGPWIDATKIPAPSAVSFNTERAQATTEQAPASDIGAFRVACGYSHMAFDDPIVFPGQPGRSHLHTFFGNTAASGNSTASSLATSGNSTCAGGTLNRSGYWVASMIDTLDGRPIVPRNGMFYYKTGYRGVVPANVKPFPSGLRMIAGDAKNAAPYAWNSPMRWHCADDAGNHTNYGLSIPDCPAANGGAVGLEIWFPQCWDGVNLDSPDHKSHMAFAENGCPATHPVPLPEISLNIYWAVGQAGAAARWRLSSDAYDATKPAGYSAHADWFDGWKPEAMRAFVSGCVASSRDCHAHLLGDGKAIY